MPSTLTADRVLTLAEECLFREGEDITTGRKAEGITTSFLFNPVRLALHAGEIVQLLDCLPESFHEKTGGGWSFLNACMTKEGDQWGEHTHVEILMCLGMALGIVRYVTPRELWRVLPGGMPYFVVLSRAKEEANPT